MKIIIYLLLLAAIISTLCICITKPTMHKSVLVYDSGYTIVPQEVVTTEELEIPVMTMPQEPEVVQITANEKIDNQISDQQRRIIEYIESDTKPAKTVTQVQTPQTVKTQTVVQPKTSNVTKQVQTPVQQQTVNVPKTTAQTQTVPNVVQRVSQRVNQSAPTGNTQTTTQSAPTGTSTKTVAQTQPVQQTKTVSAPQPVQQAKTVSAPQPVKVMTAQEEEIAWNRWRSNLQNQIMKDSKMPNMPTGTVFKFSFTVDKYGKVTNVKTWSTTPQYTPYAIQYIAPAIRSYQGHSILNFPAGSSRVTTEVTGGWKIATSAKYSTPQDFNDIEKVTR